MKKISVLKKIAAVGLIIILMAAMCVPAFAAGEEEELPPADKKTEIIAVVIAMAASTALCGAFLYFRHKENKDEERELANQRAENLVADHKSKKSK